MTEKPSLADLRLGPVRHEQLAPELIDRIKAFQLVFRDITPRTLEQWVEGFQRDINPVSEIAIWEAIANALTGFTETRELNLEARSEAFNLLLVRSSTNAQDTLECTQLQFLSLEDAHILLQLYTATPKPITYEYQ